MNITSKSALWMTATCTAISLGSIATADDKQPGMQPPMPAPAGMMKPGPMPAGMDKAALDTLVASYPECPRMGAAMMMAKYGPPQEADSDRLIWHDAGPYKHITLTRAETPHDFPKPHMDFLRHTIEYRVPDDKRAMLYAFDASMTIDPTPGELSAKCDLEGHNVLTLNIANDIVTGKKSVAEGRKSFADNVIDDVAGKMPPYVTDLQFTPPEAQADFPDVPNIPGSPRRAPAGAAMAGGTPDDAEILASVIATNDNESLASGTARMKKLDAKVLEFAAMIQMEHGQNNVDTAKVTEKTKITPMITPAVDAMYIKGAGELADLLKLDGAEFAKGYIKMMVKGHEEALEMIDKKLLPAAQNAQVKQHLVDTRAHIAMHLEHAKALQAGMGGM